MTLNRQSPLTRPLGRGALSSLRQQRGSFLLALVASVSLTIFSLDGLASGHYHVAEGSAVHHRHLFERAHQHESEQGRQNTGEHSHELESEGDAAHHHDGESDGGAPDGPRGGTVSTLEGTTSLAAKDPWVERVSALPLVAPMAVPESDVSLDRFSLTESARPPPSC